MTLACRFLGVYNVITNVETDDGTSRTLQYNNYYVYADAATDLALRNAQWQYFVNNVHAWVGKKHGPLFVF